MTCVGLDMTRMRLAQYLSNMKRATGSFTEQGHSRILRLFHTMQTSKRSINVTLTSNEHKVVEQSQTWWRMFSNFPLSMKLDWWQTTTGMAVPGIGTETVFVTLFVSTWEQWLSDLLKMLGAFQTPLYEFWSFSFHLHDTPGEQTKCYQLPPKCA